MQTIDLTAALARLLANGNFRDAFAADPQAAATQLKVRRQDIPAFLRLQPDQLEIQADILLRKRMARIKPLLPLFVQSTDDLWTTFHSYARATAWKNDIADAHGFCTFLLPANPQIASSPEWNRLEFTVQRKSLSFHLTPHPKHNHRRLQILMNTHNNRWWELNLSLERLW